MFFSDIKTEECTFEEIDLEVNNQTTEIDNSQVSSVEDSEEVHLLVKSEEMTATHLKVAPRGVPLSTTTLGAPSSSKDNPNADGSVHSFGSRRGKSPRQSQRKHLSIKTSKFWMRILKPWKWKKRSKKTKLSRTGSNSSRNGPQSVNAVDAVISPHLTSPEQYFEAATSLRHSIQDKIDMTETTPNKSIGENSNTSFHTIEIGRASTHSLNTLNSCKPSIYSVASTNTTPVSHSIQSGEHSAANKENHTPFSTTIGTATPKAKVTRFLPHPPRQTTADDCVEHSAENSPTNSDYSYSSSSSGSTTFPAFAFNAGDRSSVISLAGELGDPIFTSFSADPTLPPKFPTAEASIPEIAKDNCPTVLIENETATMNGVMRRIPVYQEVAASEPNLNAQPRKPVLRKPGQPSRFRQKQVKKESIGSPRKSDSPRNDHLPNRLTDDSDSDSDIKYRSDESDDELFVPKPSTASDKTGSLAIGRWGSSVADVDAPRSTNPAIASKIVPRPSMCESHCSHSNVEDEEEEVAINNALAAKLQRRDTMARKLDAPDPVDDIPNQTADERRRIMHRVSLKLERKLSERPLAEELEQRNILKTELAISKANMDETRKMLLRKLSFRPTIQQLKDKQIIKFNDYVEVTEAEMYDRKGDKPWTRLTPAEKALIRKELNDFKATEMDVHAESRIYTRYHRPKCLYIQSKRHINGFAFQFRELFRTCDEFSKFKYG
uniref:Phosphatase and actin regulator n=1 Tax=Panagrolaimus sp. JU765 TaxID=591449 RepID=A0AC34PYF8_9BILA